MRPLQQKAKLSGRTPMAALANRPDYYMLRTIREMDERVSAMPDEVLKGAVQTLTIQIRNRNDALQNYRSGLVIPQSGNSQNCCLLHCSPRHPACTALTRNSPRRNFAS